jgi:hypothetical protein
MLARANKVAILGPNSPPQYQSSIHLAISGHFRQGPLESGTSWLTLQRRTPSVERTFSD